MEGYVLFQKMFLQVNIFDTNVVSASNVNAFRAKTLPFDRLTRVFFFICKAFDKCCMKKCTNCQDDKISL